MAMRRHINRWVHRWRHRQAKSRLRKAGRPRSILVICDGNLCRSPYLAALLRRLLPDVEVHSAGLVPHAQSMPANATTVASRRGVDLSSHRARVVTREMIAGTDLVVVMDPRQAAHLVRHFAPMTQRVIVAADLDPTVGDRIIRDPLRQPLEVFEATYARLDRCCGVMMDVFSSLHARNRTASL